MPVKQSLGKKIQEDLAEPPEIGNIGGKTLMGHPAHDPGPLPCAQKCLPESKQQ